MPPATSQTIYPAPSPRVIAKARPEIDAHAKKFIAMSPFCVLATSGSDGSVDASPRGGNPGFVHVAGPNQLLMPDRSGNNRIDSFRNIVEGSGFVQLIFFVPGIDETLRVGGKGKLSADPDLMASMVEFGKLPRAVLQHRACSEAYFHCGKALMRSKLWSQETRVERAVMPSIGEVIHDQTGLGEPRKPGRGRRALQDAAVEASGPATSCPGLTRASTTYVAAANTLDGRVKPGHDEVVECAARCSVLALEPADVLLGVELEADALDQVELGFEEVDVVFLVLHQLSNRSRET